MFKLEPDLNPPIYKTALVSSVAILLAFAASGLMFWGFGVNPLTAYSEMIKGTFGDSSGLASVVQRAVPLLLIGSGLALAFRARFFNIGAEGQMLLGAIFASGVALFFPVSGILGVVLFFLAGFIGGSLWALIPATLREKFGVSEILSSLMLTYVAGYLVKYLIAGPWKGKSLVGYNYTEKFPDWAQLPRLEGTYINWPTLLLALVAAIVLQIVLARSKFGYGLQVVGGNPRAAHYAGISSGRITVLIALLSGGLAGLAGAGEVGGIHGRLLDPAQISLGYGFTAIIVAWLTRGNPVYAILTAVLMGFVFAGGDVLKISLSMPYRVVDVMTGLVLFFLIGAEPFLKLKLSKRPAKFEGRSAA